MNPHTIKSFKIDRLWNRSSYKITFKDQVNFLIGRNGCGKTTIITLLHHCVQLNVLEIVQYDFSSIEVVLKPTDGGKPVSLKIDREPDDGYTFSLGGKRLHLAADARNMRMRYDMINHQGYMNRFADGNLRELRNELREMVPIAWLPVSRRLPLSADDQIERRHSSQDDVESVDKCLSDLERQLQNHCGALSREHTLLQKKFEQEAMKNLLYNKSIDGAFSLQNLPQPTEEDKEKLLSAFGSLGILDNSIRKQIADHFEASRDALLNLDKGKSGSIDIHNLFILPLIKRTDNMVAFAQELENKRSELYRAVDRFAEICIRFFEDKKITITPEGTLSILAIVDKRLINWRMLSSGEKQILILLIQALLWSRSPVIYIADEPELSLHVEWQEMLVSSILELAGSCQLIIATHSPDITGGRTEAIIKIKPTMSAG